jgi:hypothetical protein
VPESLLRQGEPLLGDDLDAVDRKVADTAAARLMAVGR